MSKENQDSKEKSKARRAYGWYKNYSRANWLRRIWWFFWDFKTGADTVAAVAALGIIGTAAGLTTKDAIDYNRRIAKNNVEVAAMRWGDHSSVYTVTGYDKAGRKALFDMLVLDKNYTWKRGSWQELEQDGETLAGSDIRAKIFTNDVRNGLAKSGEYIAVGVASAEGDPLEEQKRALRRAVTSARWLAEALGDGVPIGLLNLGQHQGRCQQCETSNTSWQRPFMVIGVRDKDRGVVLIEALRDAFTGKSNLPSPENYSTFSLKRIVHN